MRFRLTSALTLISFSRIQSFTPKRFISSALTKAAMSTFTENPLTELWESQYALPPFSLIKPSHFESAFNLGLQEHIADVTAIAQNSDEPTFENTICQIDRSGHLLTRISSVYYNLCSSQCVPELQAIQTKFSPILAAHHSSIYTLPGLFERIDKVFNERHSSALNDEQVRLIERIHLDFVRAGAKFDESAKLRYKEIITKLAEVK